MIQSFVVLLSALCLGVIAKYKPCNVIDPSLWYGPQRPAPHHNLGAVKQEFPQNFDWGNVNGVNYLTRIKNQKIPIYCGSCWAQSTTSVISDRIRIMRGARFPEISISTQVLLNCDFTNDGCHGGSHFTILDWIKKNGVTDESCSPYLNRDYNDGLKCDEQAYCKDCNKNGDCWVPKNYHRYTVSDYGNIRSGDIEGIMREIQKGGPVICSVNNNPINMWKGSGVFASDDRGPTTHAVAIVGWGVTDDGIPYWNMRNSFGEEYGDNGYIKIYRGNDTIHIESYCTWVTVKDTW